VELDPANSSVIALSDEMELPYAQAPVGTHVNLRLGASPLFPSGALIAAWEDATGSGAPALMLDFRPWPFVYLGDGGSAGWWRRATNPRSASSEFDEAADGTLSCAQRAPAAQRRRAPARASTAKRDPARAAPASTTALLCETQPGEHHQMREGMVEIRATYGGEAVRVTHDELRRSTREFLRRVLDELSAGNPSLAANAVIRRLYPKSLVSSTG
jgi:hypothetical protein